MAELDFTKPICGNCNESNLEFKGEAAAPGKGKFWKCPSCGHDVVELHGNMIDTELIGPEDVTLDPSEVI